MFARLTSFQGRTDKFNKAVKMWKEIDTPDYKQLKGYRGAYLLADRDTGKGVSMTLWDNKEDAIAEEQSGHYDKSKDMYKDFLIGPTVREGYEVVAQD